MLDHLRQWGYPVALRRRFSDPSLETLTVGGVFTCWISPKASAWCWGRNADGELGNGTIVNSAAPVAVQGGLKMVAVSAGFWFACGITVDGIACCWGSDGGEMGNGDTVPVPVSGKLAFAAVSAGKGYTCGLTTGGAGFCWGNNDDGQLGDGTQRKSTVPVAIAGKQRFQSLSAGKFSGKRTTCAVDTGGQAYCWGFGDENSGGAEWHAGPGRVVGDAGFTRVNPAAHVCGLAVGGDVYCWGEGRYGQLGDGSDTNRVTPRIVPLLP